jgi:RimJ/RimL family protein N-acetyltransferase
MIAPTSLLIGDRVALRPYAAGFTEPELETLYTWGRDPDLLELSGGSPLDMTFERFREIFVAQLQRRGRAGEELFAILADSGEMIGRIGLFGLAASTGSAELGIVIGERRLWGHGYGRDAVRTLSTYGFDTLRLRRIHLFTFVHNHRAQRAFEACGFRSVRRLRRFSFDKGIHTEIEMELLAADP